MPSLHRLPATRPGPYHIHLNVSHPRYSRPPLCIYDLIVYLLRFNGALLG